MDPKHLIPGDAILIENIVNYLKAKGIFDEFRHECLADVDTKSSCQNLSQRIDGYTSKFLANETWHPDLNKNELRNKLRRHIDESGLLAVGADHVVEQVINTKIYQLFFPKIFEVVHQYVKEQSESLNKKQEINVFSESTSEKTVPEVVDNKDKTSISDPIADILSFTYSKSKPPSRKTDLSKVKKEESIVHIPEKSSSEKLSDNPTSVSSETKPVIDKEKEKIKKEEVDNSQEAKKNFVREEVKLERKKSEDVKAPVSEITSSSDIKKIKKESADKSFDKSTCETGNSNEVKKPKTESIDKSSEKNGSDLSSSNEAKKPKKEASDKSSEKNVSEAVTSSEETKSSVSAPVKPVHLSKKDFDKNKQKSKSLSAQKSSSEVKKPKKESSDKSEKHFKSKPSKSCFTITKESSSPTKHVGPSKSLPKEEKRERSKSSDSSSNKVSESSSKKTKSSSSKKDSSSLKHKEIAEKSDKSKASKSADKSDNSHIHPDSSNSEKSSKNIHYSSSYESSQGSDQEKSSSSSKKERLKHFSKHAKKEKSDHSDSGSKAHEKKRTTDGDESPSKKHKSEKDPKFGFKDNTVTEAAKISSRSNSFGSTSSVSSSSTASKDNLASNSEDQTESSGKDKKKKQAKDVCHDPKSLPPPPPPPPASGSVSCELTSSAEPSSMEDTQSSSESECSVSDEEASEESSSDSELESKDLIQNTLKESALNSSTDNINAFYDIFLYSSSSSEFEGYGNSPEKKQSSEDVNKEPGSEISVSSVHTSDLSSYDDELSSDEDVSLLTGGVKKRLTLKEAQELLRNRAILREKNKNPPSVDEKNANEVIMTKRGPQKSSSSLFSSEEESSPSEPVRSLRRERKLNPRYASSEYTSIFNCRKETFITKQSSPSVRNNSLDSSPNTELKNKKIDPLVQNSKSVKKNSFESKLNAIQKDETKQTVEDKNVNAESQDELSDNGESSSSDEMDSIMNNEKLFQKNNKPESVSDNDKLKLSVKLNPQNNSKLNVNKYSLKRKRGISESTPMKRPSSRSSVDSSSSEIVSNENKPFNNEKKSFEEKVLKDNLRASGLTDGIKKDLFCKQRTNNNGDILGQKDIFSKNSHNKTISNSEKKAES